MKGFSTGCRVVAVRGHGGVLGWGERKREEKERGEKKRERGEKKRELNAERTVLFVFLCAARREEKIFCNGAFCFIFSPPSCLFLLLLC